MERTVSKSKPIRTHFCCAPPHHLPPQSPLPVLMMSLTAVNTVSMETPTTALAYISGSSPSLHSPNAPLSRSPSPPLPLPPSPLPATRPPHREGGPRTLEGRWGVAERKLTSADRKKKRHSQQNKKKARLKKFQLWTGRVVRRFALSGVFSVHSSCLVWRLRGGKERALKGISLKLFPVKFLCSPLFGVYE